MKTMYKIANRFGLGLSQFAVKSETKKLYIVESDKDIYGVAYVGHQVKKDDPLVFDNVDDAMLKLYELAEQRVQFAQVHYSGAIEERDKIAEVIREAHKETV